MIHSFEIPEGGINALFDSGSRSAAIAPGRFETADEKLADFLKSYPGVVYAGNREDILVRPTLGQHGPVPPAVKVTRGFNWEGVKGKKDDR